MMHTTAFYQTRTGFIIVELSGLHFLGYSCFLPRGRVSLDGIILFFFLNLWRLSSLLNCHFTYV